MGNISDKILDDAIQFWQPRAGRSLNREEARQITGNLVGFFQLLADWDDEAQKRHAPITNPASNLKVDPCARDGFILPPGVASPKLDENRQTENGELQ